MARSIGAKVRETQSLLDAGDTLHGIVEAVLAELLMLDLLEFLGKLVEARLGLRLFHAGKMMVSSQAEWAWYMRAMPASAAASGSV
jgi:hypothetical protein